MKQKIAKNHAIIYPPGFLSAYFTNFVSQSLQADKMAAFNFTSPEHEPAYLSHDSMSWRVFKNPVTLFVGGMSAVLMELSEPRIRTASWESGGLRNDPAGRLRRTGLTTLAGVYAPKSQFKLHVNRINAIHGKIEGVTPSGQKFRANDPELLSWVHNTSTYGFIKAARQYAYQFDDKQADIFIQEQKQSASHFGATNPASNLGQIQDYLTSACNDKNGTLKIQEHPVLGEFLELTRTAPIFLPQFRWLQGLFLKAAVDIIPPDIRQKTGLSNSFGLNSGQRVLVRELGKLGDCLFLPTHPAIQSCRRLGLPENYLFEPEPDSNTPV